MDVGYNNPLSGNGQRPLTLNDLHNIAQDRDLDCDIEVLETGKIEVSWTERNVETFDSMSEAAEHLSHC